MNNTQNQKIAQVTDKTLIVGVDIESENHYARAILARGFEVSKKPFPFTNTEEGFESFTNWTHNLATAHKLTKIMVAILFPGAEFFRRIMMGICDYMLKKSSFSPEHIPARFAE